MGERTSWYIFCRDGERAYRNIDNNSSSLRSPAVDRVQVRAARDIAAIAVSAGVLIEGDLSKTSHASPRFNIFRVVLLEPLEQGFAHNPGAGRAFFAGVVV